jgi:hypothetical protein
MSMEEVATGMDEGNAAMQQVQGLSDRSWRNIVCGSETIMSLERNASHVAAGARYLAGIIGADQFRLPAALCDEAGNAYAGALDGSDGLGAIAAGIEDAKGHFITADEQATQMRKEVADIQRQAAALSDLIRQFIYPRQKTILREVSNGGKAAKLVQDADAEYRQQAGM